MCFISSLCDRSPAEQGIQNQPEAAPSSTTNRCNAIREAVLFGSIGLFFGAAYGLAYAIPITLVGSGIAFLCGASTATIKIIALTLFVVPVATSSIAVAFGCMTKGFTPLRYCGC